MVGYQILEKISGDANFIGLHDQLRRYREQGTSLEEMMHCLERLRVRAETVPIEEKILELMNVVSGLCASTIRVWRLR